METQLPPGVFAAGWMAVTSGNSAKRLIPHLPGPWRLRFLPVTPGLWGGRRGSLVTRAAAALPRRLGWYALGSRASSGFGHQRARGEPV